MEIVLKNEHFAIVHKPPGALSVPSRDGVKDPRPVVGIMLQEQLEMRVFPVHRLDEDVSGLLLFALNPNAHRAANQWFESHTVIKTYEASSKAVPETEQAKLRNTQTWECKLMRGKKRAYEAEFGKPSKTKALLMGESPAGRSIWHLTPLTGRSHQLRYEMARHGYPIDGDTLYGSTVEPSPGQGIELLAFDLNFERCANRDKFNLPRRVSIPSKIALK